MILQNKWPKRGKRELVQTENLVSILYSAKIN